MLEKIISGGQTGVDRAALDKAIVNGIAIGGWCPKGRRAEDGTIPHSYPLVETPFPYYWQRTLWNVRDSDATLILYFEQLSGGTATTLKNCHRLNKPVFLIDLFQPKEGNCIMQFSLWFIENDIKVLNVAGPREDEQVQVYQKSCQFMDRLFTSFLLEGKSSGEET